MESVCVLLLVLLTSPLLRITDLSFVPPCQQRHLWRGRKCKRIKKLHTLFLRILAGWLMAILKWESPMENVLVNKRIHIEKALIFPVPCWYWPHSTLEWWGYITAGILAPRREGRCKHSLFHYISYSFIFCCHQFLFPSFRFWLCGVVWCMVFICNLEGMSFTCTRNV